MQKNSRMLTMFIEESFVLFSDFGFSNVCLQSLMCFEWFCSKCIHKYINQYKSTYKSIYKTFWILLPIIPFKYFHLFYKNIDNVQLIILVWLSHLDTFRYHLLLFDNQYPRASIGKYFSPLYCGNVFDITL